MDTQARQAAQPSLKKKGCLRSLFIFLVIAFVGLFAICIIGGITDNKQNNSSELYIQGLNPVDLYLNLENKGFTVTKDFDVNTGNMWTCKAIENGVEVTVTIFSPKDTDKAQSVRATIMGDAYGSVKNGKAVAGYIATIPYDSAERERARKFVEDNYNNDKASIVIGDAEFTIYAPSVMLRMLDINKVVPASTEE